MNDVEESDEENEAESSLNTRPNRDNFVQDPAQLRAKAEERRLQKQRNRTFIPQNSGVAGKIK